ncbi:extracellular solute-binding protein [Halanaerocella petrolearia]
MQVQRKRLMAVALCLLLVFVTTSVTNAGWFDGLFGGSSDENKKEVTLNLWHIYTSENAAAYKPINDAIDRFEKDHPNVDIKSTPVENDSYKTKLKVSMGADNPPDIFMSWGAAGLEKYVDSGKVYDLTSELEAGWEDRFVPAAMDLTQFNGKYYGVPITNMIGAFVWYNTEMFDKYGLEPPETYEELKEVANTLKENEIIPFTLANKDKWTGSMYFMYLVDRLAGADDFKKAADREQEGAFNNQAFVEAGTMIQEMVEKDYFPPGVNGLEEDAGQSRNLLYTGRAGMYLMGSWAYGAIKNENPKFLDKLDFFMFPAIKSGAGDQSNIVGTPGNTYFSVSSSCENKELAVEFLKYLSDEKAGELFVEEGNIPPFKGVESKLTNPIMKKIYRKLESANYIQLWYDQYLPPQLGEVHKNTTQALFGLEMSPKEAANKMEQETKEYYKNN